MLIEVKKYLEVMNNKDWKLKYLFALESKF